MWYYSESDPILQNPTEATSWLALSTAAAAALQRVALRGVSWSWFSSAILAISFLFLQEDRLTVFASRGMLLLFSLQACFTSMKGDISPTVPQLSVNVNSQGVGGDELSGEAWGRDRSMAAAPAAYAAPEMIIPKGVLLCYRS